MVIRRHPNGPRCWVLGQRVHHGATGCALVLAAAYVAARTRGRHSPILAAAGLLLCAHDRADVREWFARRGLDSLAEAL